MKSKIRAIIQWAPKVIDVGVHYCVHRNSKGKREGFYYAYDLTAYHVASGPSPMAAMKSLFMTMWGAEAIAHESRKKGEDVRRNKLHLEHPEVIPEFKRAVKKWRGWVIKGVNWREWWPCTFKLRGKTVDVDEKA